LNADQLITYNLRDIDGSADDAFQQVALQYRVGSTGDFTNISAGFVTDASDANTATKVTAVAVQLPTEAMNQSLVQLRIITTNAAGNDEAIGVDDITIASGTVGNLPPVIDTLTPTDNGINVTANGNLTVQFNESVKKGAAGNITLKNAEDNSIVETIAVTSAAVTVSGDTVTINPSVSLPLGSQLYVEIDAGTFEDLDGADFAGITGATTWNFSTTAPEFLTKIGGYASANGAEIPAFDIVSNRLFVVAGSVVEVLNFADPSNPTKISDLAFNTDGLTGTTGFNLVPNSVAVGKLGTLSEGVVAVAIAISNPTTLDDNPGEVQFFNGNTGAYLGKVTVGFLPDMLTFTPDGTKILVANEGQPNDAYTTDPVGSVSIIDLESATIVGGLSSAEVSTASFDAFNDQVETLRLGGFRVFGPDLPSLKMWSRNISLLMQMPAKPGLPYRKTTRSLW